MPIDDLMRQFAEVVGRALARKWLSQSGGGARTEGESRRKQSEAIEAEIPAPHGTLTKNDDQP